MASPSWTYNTAGNLIASASLAASATTTVAIDLSTKFGAWVQVWNTAGASVAATAGIQVDIFPAVDTTPNYDTVSLFSQIVPAVASTAERLSFWLSSGKYQMKLTNLDATNAVTKEASDATWDSVA